MFLTAPQIQLHGGSDTNHPLADEEARQHKAACGGNLEPMPIALLELGLFLRREGGSKV